jgi:hypothetical protein
MLAAATTACRAVCESSAPTTMVWNMELLGSDPDFEVNPKSVADE